MRIGELTGNEIPPIDEFIVKISSRCNIDCDYCYEYNLGDVSWKIQPKLMKRATAELLAERITEHASQHGLESVSISLHGGEPLLAGHEYLDEICAMFRHVLGGCGMKAELGIQTNGILIDEKFAELFRRHGIRVGISLDGTKTHNDRHRTYRNGRSSYDRVMQGIACLSQHADDLFAGLLAVIDIENDAVEVVDALYATGSRNIDLLLPLYNWDSPPPRPDGDPAAYAAWYWDVWCAWKSGRWPGLRIRFLENLIKRLAGHPGAYEVMSLSPATLISVSASGQIEGVDTLKSSGAGSHVTSLNIRDHSFDDVLKTTAYQERCFPRNSLCSECKACPQREICVGGYLPHRYASKTGFANPSVYCTDLLALIERIETDIVTGKKENGVLSRPA